MMVCVILCIVCGGMGVGVFDAVCNVVCGGVSDGMCGGVSDVVSLLHPATSQKY